MMEHKTLAIIVPLFNEEETLPAFLAGIGPTLAALKQQLTVKLVFVDDGSKDKTADVVRETRWPVEVSLISLSRNFGKEAAMTAGLMQVADCDAAAIMDVDLQDPPELLLDMVQAWQGGAKVVLGRRIDRTEDGWLKRVSAQGFYRLHNSISNIEIPYNVGDFRLMDRRVVDAVNQLPENRRFMKGIFAWVGFPPVFVDYKRPARETGQSKFSGWKLWRFAIEGITSFSEVPLVVWTYIGALISLSSFVYAGAIVLRTLFFGIDVPGYASIVTIVLFLGGIQILGIGVLGEYLGRVYSEVKRRPSFVIADETTIPAHTKDA